MFDTNDDDVPAPGADAGRASDGRDPAVRLDSIDPVGAEVSALVELAALWSKVIAWATARRGEVVSVLAQHAADVAKHAGQDDHWEGGRHAVATELAMSEGTTRQSAERLVRSAVLNGMLLATGSALEAGTLSPTKADVIVEVLAEVPYPVAWAVEERVLPRADGWTPPELARKVQQALIEVDPQDAERRARDARDRGRPPMDHLRSELGAEQPPPSRARRSARRNRRRPEPGAQRHGDQSRTLI